MRVGFYQFRPKFGDINANVNKVIAALEDADAELIVLPELPFSGYYFQSVEEVIELSETVENSNSIKRLCELAAKRSMYLVTGFTEHAEDKYYNSAVLIGPEGVLHTYRKAHLFNEEKKYFAPGDTPFSIQEINGVKIGIMVCFDWAFPEVTRSLAIQGAEIICHPSNLVLSFCQQTMISRCLENGVFAITANRYGADNRPQGSLKFTGKSQIVAPGGKLLHRAHSQRDALFITDIDIALAREKHITQHNHLLNDRRPEMYTELSKPISGSIE